jgi:class 3 adenylate cyclase
MKKRTPFFAWAWLCLLPALGMAQPGQDTLRVRQLIDEAWEINETQTDAAAEKLREAIALSKARQFQAGEAAAENGLGVVEEIRGNIPAAIAHYQKALALRQALGDLKGVAALHNNLGNAYERSGRFDEALAAHRESLRIVEQLRDNTRSARAHLNIGGVYEAMGIYPEAYEQINAARLIFEEQRDTFGLAKTYTLLGHIRFELEMKSESRRWYEAALRLREQLGDEADIADALSDLANVLDEMGNRDSSLVAVPLYQRALAIRRQLDDQPGIAALYNNLGVAHKHLGQFERGMEFLRKAMEVYRKIDDQPGLMTVYNSMGDIQFGLQNQPEALQYTQRYFDIAQQIGDGKFIQKAYKDFAKIYAAMGDYAKAYAYRVKYDELRYERLDEVRTKEFERKEVLFSEGRRQREIERQQSQLALRDAELARSRTFRNALLGGAVLLALLVALLFNRNRIRARSNRELAAKNRAIQRERERADKLLKNILPEATAEELKLHNRVQPVRYESVTVMFTDFKGFTQIAESLSPEELIGELDACFRLFDEVVEQFGLEKIKTLGDAYMCAGGLPIPNDTHAVDTVRAALEMQQRLEALMAQPERKGKPHFEMRVGIHTGPVVAGIVGSHKFAYDIWGDTVNTAARLEQGSEPGKINISADTHALVQQQFRCHFRGKITAKNKGEIAMYFVDGPL